MHAIWDPSPTWTNLCLHVQHRTRACARHYGDPFRLLVDAGLVAPGSSLTGSRSVQQTMHQSQRWPDFPCTGAEWAHVGRSHRGASCSSWNGWDFLDVDTPNDPIRHLTQPPRYRGVAANPSRSNDLPADPLLEPKLRRLQTTCVTARRPHSGITRPSCNVVSSNGSGARRSGAAQGPPAYRRQSCFFRMRGLNLFVA